jgi:UDP-2,3-diacylglucosamine pyrophosphatase LpxH
MPRDRLVLVISDLHMGVGALNDFDCDIEEQLVAFLEHWRREPRDVELVINGDLLDFVQAPPFSGRELEAVSATPAVPLCFTEEQSLGKFRAIASQHGNALDALGAFVSSPGKQVTIMPGNHDADLFWPGVQSALTARLCTGGHAQLQPRILLDASYQPEGHAHLWIEHGHQHDPINCFVANGRPCWSREELPIFPSASGEPRLYECLGTRFLIRYLNLIDADYPFVDNVKPFGRFLRLFGLSAVMPGYGPLKVAVAVAAMLRHLATTAVQRPSDLMEEMLPTAGDNDAALRKAIVSALPGEIEAFVGALERAGFPEYRSPVVMADDGKSLRELADFVAEHPDTLDALGDIDPDGVMELARGFQADETDDLRQAAERVLDSGAAHFVTMGHTHERVDGDRYFNTGSWTRYYQYEPQAPLQPWSMLRPEAQATFPYWLSYVQSEAGSIPTVTMPTFMRHPR